MNDMALLAFLASFSLNLVVQTGLGVKEIFGNISPRGASTQGIRGNVRLSYWAVMALVVFALWLLWTYILTPFTLGFFDIIFIFPLCALAVYLIDRRFAVKGENSGENAGKAESTAGVYPSIIPLCLTALFMTLRLASSAAGAALLSVFFALGCVFSSLILGAIHQSSLSEAGVKNVRGVPLAYISSGLLALIFFALSSIVLK